MDGRLEIANKDFNAVNENLKSMPKFVSDWVLSLRAKNCSAKTCRTYIGIVRRYLESINDNIIDVSIKDFTKTNVKMFFVSCQTKTDLNGEISKTSRSYMNSVWSCLNNFFTYLESEELIKKNPIDKNSRPGGNDLERINEHRILLTKKDFNKILKVVFDDSFYQDGRRYLKYRNIAIMRVFMNTGLRESALISINISDINFENNTLFIFDKGEIPHKFLLSDNCISDIKEWLPYREQILNNKNMCTDALFISELGNRMSVTALTYLVKNATKVSLGHSVSPHKLRSGVCSILYKETKDIEFVRRFIGHSDVSVTQRYIVTGGDELKRGNEILGGF